MQIEQKKRATKLRFTFEDERFNYAYEDEHGSGDADIAYGELPANKTIRIEQNLWLRNVGYIWCVVGLIQVVLVFSSRGSFAGTGFWLLLGLGCLAWWRLTKLRYTVFQPEQGGVFILQDKNHDRIVEELQTRRRKQLLDWYGEVNLESDYDNELKKFDWLRDQKVLSEDELKRKIEQLKSGHEKLPEDPPVWRE